MTRFLIMLTIYILSGLPAMTQAVQNDRFKHHSVANPLPGPEGLGTGGFSLADYDNDGDLDITISPNDTSGPVYLYENKGGTWLNHTIGTGDALQLGTVAADVDRDGNIDLVMSRFWFRNPGASNGAQKTKWEKKFYNGALDDENHDIAAADINLDGIVDIISFSQTMGKGILRWYDVRDAANWEHHTVSDNVNDLVKDVEGSNGIHGGLSFREGSIKIQAKQRMLRGGLLSGLLKRELFLIPMDLAAEAGLQTWMLMETTTWFIQIAMAQTATDIILKI